MTKLIKLMPLLFGLALMAGLPVTVSGQQSATVQFAQAQYQVSESVGRAALVIDVIGTPQSCPVASPFSVQVDTRQGSATPSGDYVAFSGLVSFAACQAQRSVQIALRDNSTVERDESFTVQLSRPAALDPAITLGTDEATVTIVDDDLSFIRLNSFDYSVGENGGTVEVTAEASHPIAFPVDVQLSTFDATALAGEDYQATSTTLNFAPGDTSQSTEITIINDDLVETDVESFQVALSTQETNPDISVRTLRSNVSITDDDSATVSLSSAEYTVSETSGTVRITVQVDGGPAGCPVDFRFSVRLSTLDGTAVSGDTTFDFTQLQSATLVFDACDRQSDIEITIFNDLIVERTETFRLKLERTPALDEDIRLGRTDATVDIEDNDTATLSLSVPDSAVAEGNGPITIAATVVTPDISCPVEFPFSVRLSTIEDTAENSDFSRLRDHTLRFAACDKIKDARINISDDRFVEHTESFMVRMEPTPDLDDTITFGTSEGTVEITDDDEASVSFRKTYNSVVEDEESVELCVEVTQPGVAFPFFVNFQLDRPDDRATFNSDYRPSATFLEIRSRALSQCVDVIIVDDAITEAPESFEVQMQKSSGLIASVSLDPVKEVTEVEILDDDSATVGFMDRSPQTESIWAVTEGESYRVDIHPYPDLICPAQFYFEVGLSYTDPDNALVTGTTIPSDVPFDPCQNIHAFDVNTTSVEEGEIAEVVFTLGAISAENPTRPDGQFVGYQPIQLESDPTFTLKVFDTASSFLQFDSPEYGVDEGDGTVTVEVSFSDPLTEDLTLEFQVTNSTARSGSDYTQDTSEVTVATGASSATHTITIVDDSTLEPTEQFIVRVVPGDGSDQFDGYGLLETSVVIEDDDTASVSFANSEVVVNEGDWFQVELLVTSPEDDCGINFPFAVSVPYTGPAGSVTGGPGSSPLFSFRACESARAMNFRAGEDAGDSEVEFSLAANRFSDSRIAPGPTPALTVRILDTDPFAHNPSEDFDTLSAAGNTNPEGIWSDGTTMWVADTADDKIYAYNLATKAREEGKEFNTLAAAGNNNPEGIWSNGTTMWVVDEGDDTIYAYNMSTKARDSDKDINILSGEGDGFPDHIWSNGRTIWLADPVPDKIFAYDLTTKERDAEKDFDTLDAGNTVAEGLWSDGTTMWVADQNPDKIFAYDLASKERDADKEFNTLDDAANNIPSGLWSDGKTMWVADYEDGKIYAYYMPPNAMTRPAIRPRTTRSSVDDVPEPQPAKVDAIKVDECVTEVDGSEDDGSGEEGSSDQVESPEVGSIQVGGAVSGQWESDCASISRGGSLAQYYSFSLPITTAVEIDLSSSLDTYLVLRRDGLSGEVVAQDDNSGDGLGSRISQTLPAGDYMIEATTANTASVEAEFSLFITIVPRVLYSGSVSSVAHRGYAPVGPTMTVKLLPTLPTGTLEITIEDTDGFASGAGPLGGPQTESGSAGTVLIALPQSAWLAYSDLTVEAKQSGSWATHTISDEEDLLAEEDMDSDFSSILDQVSGLVQEGADATGIVDSLNTLLSGASVPAAVPDSSALDDIFTEDYSNCVSQVVVPWLVKASETMGVRVSVPVEISVGDYLSVAASFVADGDEKALAQLHDLMDTKEEPPGCQRPTEPEN